MSERGDSLTGRINRTGAVLVVRCVGAGGYLIDDLTRRSARGALAEASWAETGALPDYAYETAGRVPEEEAVRGMASEALARAEAVILSRRKGAYADPGGLQKKPFRPVGLAVVADLAIGLKQEWAEKHGDYAGRPHIAYVAWATRTKMYAGRYLIGRTGEVPGKAPGGSKLGWRYGRYWEETWLRKVAQAQALAACRFGYDVAGGAAFVEAMEPEACVAAVAPPGVVVGCKDARWFDADGAPSPPPTGPLTFVVGRFDPFHRAYRAMESWAKRNGLPPLVWVLDTKGHGRPWFDALDAQTFGALRGQRVLVAPVGGFGNVLDVVGWRAGHHVVCGSDEWNRETKYGAVSAALQDFNEYGHSGRLHVLPRPGHEPAPVPEHVNVSIASDWTPLPYSGADERATNPSVLLS